jgi:hypothetical protein
MTLIIPLLEPLLIPFCIGNIKAKMLKAFEAARLYNQIT